MLYNIHDPQSVLTKRYNDITAYTNINSKNNLSDCVIKLTSGNPFGFGAYVPELLSNISFGGSSFVTRM